MRPLRSGDGHRVVEGLRRIGRGIHHHLRPAVRGLAGAGHHVLLLHVDGDVGAQLAGEGELVRVAAEAGDHDLARAGRAGGDDTAESALARAQDDHAVARGGGGNGARPRETGRERVEHHGHPGGDARVHLLDHREGRGTCARRIRPRAAGAGRRRCSHRCRPGCGRPAARSGRTPRSGRSHSLSARRRDRPRARPSAPGPVARSPR